MAYTTDIDTDAFPYFKLCTLSSYCRQNLSKVDDSDIQSSLGLVKADWDQLANAVEALSTYVGKRFLRKQTKWKIIYKFFCIFCHDLALDPTKPHTMRNMVSFDMYKLFSRLIDSKDNRIGVLRMENLRSKL